VLGVGVAAVCVAAVPPAVSLAIPPQCADISPNTRLCTTNGSTAIVTSPPRNRTFNRLAAPWGLGWPSGFVFAIG